MKAVWKYPTKPDIFGHELPEGAKVVHFDMQHGEPTMWVLVDTDAPLEQRPFLVAGTGHELPVDARYIASCIDSSLQLVWHLFEPLSQAKP